jgi:hypothetical protein
MTNKQRKSTDDLVAERERLLSAILQAKFALAAYNPARAKEIIDEALSPVNKDAPCQHVFLPGKPPKCVKCGGLAPVGAEVENT